MPALHQDKTRAEKAARQQANNVIAFARVKVSEIQVNPPSNGAAPSNAEDQRQRCITINEKFNWIDAVMADHNLGARAKVVAYWIMQHVNRETGHAFVSDATITDKTGIANRWVRIARNNLRAAGWITWKRTRTANVYSTLAEPMAGIAEHQQELKRQREERRMKNRNLPPDRQRAAEPDTPQTDHLRNDVRQGAAEHDGQQVAELVRQRAADIPISDYPLDEPIKESIYTGSSSAVEIISAFETFWQQYPRRVGKLKAEKIYDDILKSGRASADDLLAGAGRYAAERAGQDATFTKHPSTWLNAGGWMDEPQTAQGLAKPGSVYAGLRSFVEGSRGK